MSLFPTKRLSFETAVPPARLIEALAKHVDTGTTPVEKPEYKGIIGDGGFRIKYLLKPSFVEGSVIDKAYGSDIDAEVSLPPSYGVLMVFAYISLAFAFFLSSGLVFGVLKFHKPLTTANLIGAGMYYLPSLVSYLLYATALRQAHRWNEIFIEDLLNRLTKPQS